jgi:hypothetical protein
LTYGDSEEEKSNEGARSETNKGREGRKDPANLVKPFEDQPALTRNLY